MTEQIITFPPIEILLVPLLAGVLIILFAIWLGEKLKIF
jgi:hypothetical protein